MQITLDLWPHPLTAAGRCTRLLTVASGATVADVVGPGLADCAVELNGARLAPAAWGEPLPPGAVVVVRPLGANGLRSVLQLATIVAALYVPGLSAFAEWSGWATKALSAGIMVAGGLVTNALVPPRVPSPVSPRAAPESVYSLSGGANAARPWEPLPLVLGTHRMYPDLASTPYQELRGDDQYLGQIFDFGLGDKLVVSALHIGDTPLDEFDDTDLDWGLAGADIANVPGNVHIDARFQTAELDWPDATGATEAEWVVRRSGRGARKLEVTLSGRLYRIDGADVANQSMGVQIGYRILATDSAPTPAWTDQSYTLGHDKRSDYRRTITLTVAEGEYDVRVRRTTAPPTSRTETAEMWWTLLATQQADGGDYGGRNRLGLVVRASGQLSGRLDRLSAVVAQHVPVWDADTSAWTVGATSNPAWIFRWLARGVWVGTVAEGNRRLLAGAGLDADRVDDETLKRWGAWCDTKRLTCNYVARGETLQQLLEMVARCGRATLSWANGRLGVVWDAADRAATALVTPANIVAGSYRTQWSGDRVADEIVGRYVDAAASYERREVRRTAPGATTVQIVATVDLSGVTSADQAQREVNLQAGRQAYHRRRHEWEMPLDALPAARGDVVYVTHSLIDGGQRGRLKAIGSGGEVTLSEFVTPDDDARLLISLPDGRLYESDNVAAPAGVTTPSDRVVLTPALPGPQNAAPGAAWDPLDCLWRWETSTPVAAVRIVAIVPTDAGVVRIEAIDETALYYAAEDLPLGEPLPPVSWIPPQVTGAVFEVDRITTDGGDHLAITMTLATRGDWRGGVVYTLDARRARTQRARMVDGDFVASWVQPWADAITILVIPGTVAAPLGPKFETIFRPGNLSVDVLYRSCPAEQGWPGTRAGFEIVDGELRGTATNAEYTWSTLTTWTAWTTWSGGAPASTASYTSVPIAVTRPVTWRMDSSAIYTGTVTVEGRVADTEAGLAAAAWMDVERDSLASHAQFRWTLRGDGTQSLLLADLCYQIVQVSA